MNRQIVCRACVREMSPQEHVGEGRKMVFGKLHGHAHCDICNLLMKPGDQAWAMSLFLDGQYFKWEDEFLERAR